MARRGLCALAAALALVGSAAAGTVPFQVADTVHGRIFGWARSGTTWFAVYTSGRSGGWCGLQGATWRMALVETAKTPFRIAADRAIGGAMCGNDLAWVRAGRFSDGRHDEVAFMLWATPSIGATTSIYRVDGGHFVKLASFGGDRVTIGRGTVTVAFENRGRSSKGELEDVYRFQGGRYRLVARK